MNTHSAHPHNHPTALGSKAADGQNSRPHNGLVMLIVPDEFPTAELEALSDRMREAAVTPSELALVERCSANSLEVVHLTALCSALGYFEPTLGPDGGAVLSEVTQLNPAEQAELQRSICDYFLAVADVTGTLDHPLRGMLSREVELDICRRALGAEGETYLPRRLHATIDVLVNLGVDFEAARDSGVWTIACPN